VLFIILTSHYYRDKIAGEWGERKGCGRGCTCPFNQW